MIEVFEAKFNAEETQVSSHIMASLALTNNENHDFFSQKSTTYAIGNAEETEDDDWDF